MSFRTRKKVKTIIISVVVIALLLGSAGALVAIFNNDTREIGSSAFSVGAIDENGAFVESETSICTKELIECQGLAIEPAFEAEGTFQVFYYGFNKTFVGKTEVFNSAKDIYSRGEDFPFAKYARILITPIPDEEDEDYNIGIFDIPGIVSDYSITVDKKQNFTLDSIIGDAENVYVSAELCELFDGTLHDSTLEKRGFFYSNLVEKKDSTHLIVCIPSEMFKDSSVPRLYVSDTSGYCTEFEDFEYIFLIDDGNKAYFAYNLNASELNGVSFDEVGFRIGGNSVTSAEMYLVKVGG